MKIVLYGPSGSGKTTVGKMLAQSLQIKFTDVDQEIESRQGRKITDIFQQEGEEAFRCYEKEMLQEISRLEDGVVALGGGALLREENRKLVENSGTVVCLMTSPEVILDRIRTQEGQRPLLNGDVIGKLTKMLADRRIHYESFANRIHTDGLRPEEVCWKTQVLAGRFSIEGMGSGYEVAVEPGLLTHVGEKLIKLGLKGPVAVVTDSNIAPLYADRVKVSLEKAGYAVVNTPEVFFRVIAAGEASKTIACAMDLWRFFVQNKLERGSTVLALGGGVVGDLTGYASSAYLRGIRWVNIPTSLLAMVDSSLGGKTAVNLPEGKNLVGAFHAPDGVWTDPDVLTTLPREELRNGMGEVIKHGVIGDPELFHLCEGGWQSVETNLDAIICKAVAVKVKVICEDPYEKGLRQTLNFGHTIGHAVESASDYALKHGEAVAIGMVLETILAEKMGLAVRGLSDKIGSVLEGLDLPVSIPKNLSKETILNKMTRDKKKMDGKVLFALPASIGDVRYGIDPGALETMSEVLFRGIMREGK